MRGARRQKKVGWRGSCPEPGCPHRGRGNPVSHPGPPNLVGGNGALAFMGIQRCPKPAGPLRVGSGSRAFVHVRGWAGCGPRRPRCRAGSPQDVMVREVSAISLGGSARPKLVPQENARFADRCGAGMAAGREQGARLSPPAFRGFQVRAVAPACPGSSLVPRSLGKTWGHGSSCSLTAGGLNWGSFRSETRLCLSTDPWILNLPFPRGPA